MTDFNKTKQNKILTLTMLTMTTAAAVAWTAGDSRTGLPVAQRDVALLEQLLSDLRVIHLYF